MVRDQAGGHPEQLAKIAVALHTLEDLFKYQQPVGLADRPNAAGEIGHCLVWMFVLVHCHRIIVQPAFDYITTRNCVKPQDWSLTQFA